MQEVELVAVSKDGEYLEVHPTTLAAHKNAGWKACDKRATQEDVEHEATKKLGIADMRAALASKGIEFNEGAKKAELQALLDAAS